MTELHTHGRFPGGLAPVFAALAVIAAVGASLWIKSRDDTAPAAPMIAAPAPAPAAAPTTAPSAAARAFLAFARSDPPDELPLDHGYTADGLRRLGAALAGEGALWRDRAQRLEEAAAELEKDAASLQHAGIARAAFIAAAEWLQAESARVAAEALDASEPLRSQKERVHRFFRAAAEGLEERRG